MSKVSKEVENLVRKWVEWDPNEQTRKEIQDLFNNGNENELKKRLGSRMTFGTAGLRETMKAGFAYMNDLTVIQASQGLATYLEKTVSNGKQQGVIVGYDGRHNSRRFAELTANIFLSRGFVVHLFNTTVPTPLTSFGVRDRGCCAGIMITASHNPKQDNGYKVYWSNSCQIIEPHDKGISECIMENLEPWKVNPKLYQTSPLLHDPTVEVCSHYMQRIIEWSFCREVNPKQKLKIVYTPMHGVGHPYAQKAFAAFGLPEYIPVKEQMDVDPEFPTVPFPNPEEGKGALKLAIQTADHVGAPVIIANDPDADRLAAAEKLPSGEWKIFTGNELGILLADWIITQFKKRNPDFSLSKCVVLSTAVSSKMLSVMARAEGLYYEETLTGFKWLGNKAEELIKKGMKFLFAFEEAIGYMVGDVCLDKDGIRGAAVLAEMASSYYSQNVTLLQRLKTLQQKYGYFATNNRYFFINDMTKLAPIFNKIRNGGKYTDKCGSFKIRHIRDLTAPGYDSQQSDKKPILPVSRNTQMITFFFENGAIATLRGSGTEPKLKYYVELSGNANESERVDAELNRLVQAIIENFLEPSKNDLKPPADS
jgi:phosphomannomutase